MEINKIEYEIGVYDLEGHFIDSSDSWEYLEKEFEITNLLVKSYLHFNSSITNNYQLRFKNLKLKSSVLPVEIGNVVNLNNAGIRERPIAKYYKNKLICIYSSLIEAGEKTKINSGTICKSCQKGYKAGVFNFKYIK